MVCKLNRSLYGLKQAGREWAILFARFLTEWGFKRSKIDVCMYIYVDGDTILWCRLFGMSGATDVLYRHTHVHVVTYALYYVHCPSTLSTCCVRSELSEVS